VSTPSERHDTAPELPTIRWWLVTVLGYALIAAIVFLPALRSYFSSDDFLHLSTVIEGGLPFAPTGSGRGFLRPMVGLSFLAEHALWGIHPLGYHASNVVLHVANSVLVACVSLLIVSGCARHKDMARLAGLIFLVLACHAESVSWISGRTDLLATFFSLLTLCTVIYGLRLHRVWMLVTGAVFFVLALSCKESALALPFLVLATTCFLWQEGVVTLDRRYAVSSIAVITGIVTGYFLLRYWQLGAFVAGYGAQGHLRFHQDLLAQAMARFAWRVYLPPLPDSTAALLSPMASRLGDIFTLALLLHGVLWAILAWKRKAWRRGFYCYTGFWLALLPVINVRIQWTNVEGERFLYLASLFAALGAAWFLGGLSRRPLRWALLGAFLLLQCASLWTSNQRWYHAEETARDVISGLQSFGHDKTLVLLNKPDSYDGALVLRTGLEEGVRYFGDAPCMECRVEVLYATTLFELDHNFELLPHSESEGSYLLQAIDGHSVMVEEDYYDRIETWNGEDRQSAFRFRSALQDSVILLYTSNGVSSVPRTRDAATPTSR